MPVESTVSRVQYDTNGTTGPWTIPFYFLSNADIRVVYADASGNETVLALNVGYTLTGAGVETGGAATTTTAYAAGGTITIRRDLDALQPEEFTDGDAFPAAALNRGLDRATMLLQQFEEVIGRSLVIPESENNDMTLPAVADRASKVLAFDSDGTPTVIVGVDSGSAAALDLDLQDTASATKGANKIGTNGDLDYDTDTLGHVVQAMGYPVTAYPHNANWAGTTDTSAAFADALSRHHVIEIPAGTYLGQIDLSNLRGKKIVGAGRDRTVLKNFGNAPVIKFNNGTSDCKLNTVQDLRIQNRDSAVYTTADGIEIDGNATNENDFHTFERVEILSMRYGVNVKNRTIWNTWRDVHIAASLLNGWHLDVTENVSQQTFITCRFATSVAGHGFYAKKASGDALSGWSFVTCTFEKNALNGMRVEGASSGLAGWSLIGGYMEENTTTVAASATSPRKANIFIDASLCIDFNVIGTTLYGTPLATPLDWGLYISSATASGYISARPGSYALGFANLPAGFIVAPLAGGTTTTTLAAGSYSLASMATETTGTDTLTLTGCTTSPTGTARTVKQRNQVTVYIPTIEGTSNTTAATLTGLPSAFAPTRQQIVLARIKNNGTTTVGLAQIETSGTITLYSDIGGAAFTGSGTKGIQNCTLTYSTE